MDEGVFIVVALVIILGLIAGLYFMLDLYSQRVLGFAAEARGREQREIVNHERLARALNGLVDEVAVLTDALKNERILCSHTEAAGRVAANKAARGAPAPALPAPDDRKTEKTPPPPQAIAGGAEIPADDEATCVLTRTEVPVAPRKTTARLTPTRVSAGTHTAGG